MFMMGGLQAKSFLHTTHCQDYNHGVTITQLLGSEDPRIVLEAARLLSALWGQTSQEQLVQPVQAAGMQQMRLVEYTGGGEVRR